MAEPSWQDLYDVGKAMLQSRRPTLVVEEGDVSDAILAGAASMAMAVIAYANAKFRRCFLDGATGSDLTALAHDRGVDRDLGSKSVGTITLSRPSAAAGGGTLSAGFTVATTPDDNGDFASFTIDEDAVFGALDLTVDVTATCTIVGKDGNVAADTIDRMLGLDGSPAFDTTIVVTNAALFAGGVEEESDEDLRDRVRGFFLTQARGTIDAIIFGAKEVDGVERVTVSVDGAGVVTVYVADADGNSSTALVALVSAELEDWRAAGDVVYVTGGVIVEQEFDISLTVRTGVDINALVDRVRQAVISRVGRLNPGETLYRDMVSAAVRAVDPDAILQVVLNTPAANVTPAANELIRTSIPLISFS